MLPKLKTAELLKQINSYLDRGQKPEEFTVRRWQRAAESLSKSEPVGRMVLLGILAGIQEDIPAMRAHFEEALFIFPGNEYVLHNYAISLNNTGFLHEAAEKIYLLSLKKPDNLDYMNLTINYTARIGMITRAIELITMFEKLSPQNENPQKKVLQDLSLLMNKYGITDEILEKIIEIAYAVLYKHGMFYLSQYTIEVCNDDGYEWLDYEIILPPGLSDEKIFALDEALINAYSDSDLPAEALQYFSPMFSTAGYA